MLPGIERVAFSYASILNLLQLTVKYNAGRANHTLNRRMRALF